MRIKNKLLSIALAAFLTVAVAGQAKAYFGNGLDAGNLVQFIYAEPGGDYTDNEVGTDLFTDNGLSFPTYEFTGGSIVLDTKDASTFLNNFSTTDNWADLQVGYYSSTYSLTTGESHRYVAMTTPDLFDIGASWSGVNTSAMYLSTHYGTHPDYEGNQVVVGPTSHYSSYDCLMNQDSFVPGSYGEFNNAPYVNFGEASLAPLAAGAGSYVDMYLFEAEGAGWQPGDFVTDTYRATMRIGINEAGELYTMMTPVPIPGAVWLFGSGLLALVGIRRRKSA
ncbi:VPLPA-CTERM sorting domain-containing protein [candidate division WOR-3 bacterium]|nr:VPLPA-CTERM sorting domain-containing protein [candidate division WOR-3 bacterium]